MHINENTSFKSNLQLLIQLFKKQFIQHYLKMICLTYCSPF